jgi:uncharacterized protein YhaN
MDDILINFDNKRKQKASELIQLIAKDNQVIIFSCHKQTLDIFKNFKLLNLRNYC